jgi:hypothetical protein
LSSRCGSGGKACHFVLELVGDACDGSFQVARFFNKRFKGIEQLFCMITQQGWLEINDLGLQIFCIALNVDQSGQVLALAVFDEIGFFGALIRRDPSRRLVGISSNARKVETHFAIDVDVVCVHGYLLSWLVRTRKERAGRKSGASTARETGNTDPWSGPPVERPAPCQSDA